ncbi:hypothetical protein O4215_20610 [Rhodococcus maanshanensis]|uniref:hypothetical protein n=1 Tax=Rhodococcus maanshanensis TaxID=183556 RepID=UPI0022B2EA43|nr:hypothetical protein [Rhodococcus maanshanensis]MCZ4557967.1 hypothetical protein [Rhodococcus maanshanensis]
MTEVWMALPYTKPPLSLNDRGASRGASFAKAAATRTLREQVVALAEAAGLPRNLDHVTVQLHYRPRDNRRRDTDNLVATLKPIADALTPGKQARTVTRAGKTRRLPAQAGYGMVADDTPHYMSKPEPIIHPAIKGEPGLLWVTVTWQTVAEAVAEVAARQQLTA